DEIGDELNGLGTEIADYLEILRSRERVITIIRDELTAIRDQYATPRKTEITDAASDFEDEDLIAREDMVVTVTHGGYIKRVPLSTYRAQNRGGKGRSGMATRDEDFVSRLFVANTHTPVLFFTSRGIVYKIKVWRLPLAAANARGKALINILPLEQGERITSIMPMPEDETTWSDLDIMFATDRGTVRRNSLADFVEVRQNGKIAMKLEEGDGIIGVDTCSAADDVLLTTAGGQAIRFQVDEVRVFKGRDSTGVRGIHLAEGDIVISMAIVRHFEATSDERVAYLKMSRAVRGEGDSDEVMADDEEGVAGELGQDRYVAMSEAEQFILTISENGYGKRTSSHEYRITGRGGKGIVAMAVNKRNGKLIASFPVENEDQIMLVTDQGQMTRIPVEGKKPIRVISRGSQGVIVFDTADEEKVVSVERISEPEDDDEGDAPEAMDTPDAPDGPETPDEPAAE
ncbi:MAG TPA: DNA gyrase C-terminal beta-propeller domain-containing protein, partial [Devosia sp.]|nr:DNA gyrase C-terminal beta-propeller domain-containing protein [Devosia sp.]